MAEEPKPQEDAPQPDEKEPSEKEPDEKPPKKAEPGEGPQPEVVHWPIDCVVTNLNALDDRAFMARRGGGEYFWDSQHHGDSGDQFLLTLTLSSTGVTPAETPFNVELRYLVRQQGEQKTTGAFLFSPPAIVTYRAHAPNNGSFIQQVKLQTIRFYAGLTQFGDAEVSIYPFYHGEYVGPIVDGIQVPTTFIIHAPMPQT